MNKAMQDVSDVALIAQFKSGDRTAFDEIDGRYRPRLLRFFRSRTNSSDEAEELTQATLARAAEALGALRRDEFFPGWLFQIARRVWIDVARRSRPTVPYDESAADSDSAYSSPETVFSAEGGRRPDGGELGCRPPDDEASDAEERANLWTIARKVLNKTEFQAVWYHYVDELPDAEIARRLGKTPVATRVALTRARKKLAEFLRPIAK